ncbi:MAG: AAA family ATPase, partial [Longimicrobiales bacterium]
MPGRITVQRLPLVGRSEELGILRATLPRAAGGFGATAIAGPGGVGKSRLAHAFLQDARAQGCTVASGQAYAAEQGVPFAPVSDAFAPLLRGLPVEQLRSLISGTERELAQLFPTALAHAVPAGAPGVDSSAQLLWAFAEFTRRLTADAPLVVLIEDMQWADASSRELLHFLIRHTTDAQVSV